MADIVAKMTPPQITPKATEEVTEKEVWEDILEHKLRGVMFHEKMMEECEAKELKGYAMMHKYHAMDEFAEYLHLMKDYIKCYKETPRVPLSFENEHVMIEGTTVEDKMCSGLKIYKDYETETLDYLKECKMKVKEKDDVCKLIKDVKQELRFIDELEDEMEEYDGDIICYEKLNRWLCSKFKSKLGDFAH